ncbi:TPA: hypothetical protein ACX6PO_002271 [Photobacterium damselae]
MKFSEMPHEELWLIIKISEDKLVGSGITLSNCLKAKVNYLLLLLGKEMKYNEKKVIELMNSSYGTNYVWTPQGGGYNPYAEDNLSG